MTLIACTPQRTPAADGTRFLTRSPSSHAPRKNTLSAVRSVGKARRRLFIDDNDDVIDKEQQMNELKEQQEMLQKAANERWGFDFRVGRPLERLDGNARRWEWFGGETRREQGCKEQGEYGSGDDDRGSGIVSKASSARRKLLGPVGEADNVENSVVSGRAERNCYAGLGGVQRSREDFRLFGGSVGVAQNIGENVVMGMGGRVGEGRGARKQLVFTTCPSLVASATHPADSTPTSVKSATSSSSSASTSHLLSCDSSAISSSGRRVHILTDSESELPSSPFPSLTKPSMSLDISSHSSQLAPFKRTISVTSSQSARLTSFRGEKRKLQPSTHFLTEFFPVNKRLRYVDSKSDS